MIKIPGTDEGVPAIEQAIYEGINVNVTLLFAVEAYEKVAEAFIRGLERRREAGESLDVHSVASFFVSRVDTEVDKRLEALGRAPTCRARPGCGTRAPPTSASRRSSTASASPRCARPARRCSGRCGPPPASRTPHYPDTMYVDGLVAPDTVNTMPMPTLLAAGESGEVTGATADAPTADVERALGRSPTRASTWTT